MQSSGQIARDTRNLPLFLGNESEEGASLTAIRAAARVRLVSLHLNWRLRPQGSTAYMSDCAYTIKSYRKRQEKDDTPSLTFSVLIFSGSVMMHR